MNKSVITSVSPKECELIASGKQTMLVRKTRPKIETPFKCYIYCTKDGLVIYGDSKVYVTDTLKLLKGIAIKSFENSSKLHKWNGAVIGSFVCDEIYVRPANVIYYGKGKKDYLDLLKSACMTEREALDYMGGQFNRDTYFWHISDLKIYDKPKELGELGNYKTEWVQWYHSDDKVFYPLKRMSGSWCYIEEE